MKQDDDDTDQKSNDDSEGLVESTFSSDIEKDDLDNLLELLHVDQTRRDKTLQTWSLPLPMKRSRADTFIACTSHPNLQHPTGAIAPPLLNHPKSTINMLRESGIVLAQVISLPKVGGDQSVPQPTAGAEYNVPQQQQATYDVAKQLMEAMVFTRPDGQSFPMWST